MKKEIFKSLKKGLTVVLATTWVATAASAAGFLSFGHPEVGGSGCADETVSYSFDYELNALNIEFDGYVSITKGKTIKRVTCNMAIPVSVPAGMQVGIVVQTLDFSSYLSSNVRGRIGFEYFLAGGVGNPVSIDLPTGHIFGSIGNEEIIWSGCGEDVNLRLNTSILLRNSSPSSRRSWAWVEIGPEIVISAVVKSCGPNNGIFEIK
ncbi:MAG: hypothetical protein A2504_12455 [Bdellovibrionales bacterium RIFOXYD12_FULL_39_22]|nr:MAG: hypothetical protein A2385_00205 [Bdellovibrionales bacterium RIFOXYB1_FULL_39_21]OFZ44077.1 MAG: hypothetical protein A2485_03870 [Bdellovibrionales bacterium RIFOXYC12_FULL_39_17]OFZ48521.1 MAG: hypothetical protein A2404_07200 [Bdellovibrionales bacterium RIFOXYC1_FULL_39_130]OFZ71331.1 MAG: hypothetical protein A2451_10040 [Bdellovibrionales bacterium RIFOXYC2_FULL_39_8]OFZ76709.1 MAG: hypothetical protein A2560_11575 [Bdellovibrionales bacterium RIFOXYD1_FULL_39_84]OFZ94987.1 MAG: